MNVEAFPKSVWSVRVAYEGVRTTFWFAGYDKPSLGRIIKAIATAHHKSLTLDDWDNVVIHSVGVVRGAVFVE